MFHRSPCSAIKASVTCLAARHREKQLCRAWFATALPYVLYSLHRRSCGALSSPSCSSPVGSNIDNRWGFFLVNSSGIYSIWDVVNSNNACLDISFLLSGFQLLSSVWTLCFLDWYFTLPRYDVNSKLKEKSKLLFSSERKGTNFSHNIHGRGDFWHS